MIPEDRRGHGTGPNVEVICKIDTGAGADVRSISVFRRLCLMMFDSTGEVWTTLTVYQGTTIKQFGVRVIKGILNNKK